MGFGEQSFIPLHDGLVIDEKVYEIPGKSLIAMIRDFTRCRLVDIRSSD